MSPFINQNFIYLSCHSMTFIRDYPVDFYNVHTSLVIPCISTKLIHQSTFTFIHIHPRLCREEMKRSNSKSSKKLIQINSRLTEIAIGFWNCSRSLRFLFSLKIWKVVCYDLLTREFLLFYKRFPSLHIFSHGISNAEITFIPQIS
jgi:hypothetical protein